MTSSGNVELTGDEAKELYRALNYVVVSLDQIGSKYANSRSDLVDALLAFIVDGDVFRTLSGARRSLDAALSRSLTEDQVLGLVEGLEYWTDGQ